MAESASKSYSTDPALYLYTSLTSGSSHIVTATSRLETILKANRIPFKALDIATDEKARMIWGRRAGKDESGRVRKIPGLVQMGLVLGDLVEIEEWNEYGELKEHVSIYQEGGAPAKSAKPVPSKAPAPVLQENMKPESAAVSKDTETAKFPTAEPNNITLALRQVGQEAAQKAKEVKKKVAETFTGVGEAEPKKEIEKQNASAPSAEPVSPKRTIAETAVLQSPTSTAWRRAPDSFPPLPTIDTHKKDNGPLEIPKSTAWKPTDTNGPVTQHRGSSVSEASAECIQKIENESAVPEEDEADAEEAVKD